MKGIRRNQGICRNCNDANNHRESMLYWGERGTDSRGGTRALGRQEILALRGLTPSAGVRRAA